VPSRGRTSVIATEPRSTAAFELVPCPVCRATEASPFLAGCRERLLDLPDEFSLVRCDACGLVRLNPRPTPDAIGAYYPAEYLPFGAEMLPPSGGLKRLLQSTLRRVYEWRQGGPPYQLVGAPGRRVLDVGCGTGWFLDRFTTTGWEAWGVELNAAAAAKARGRPGVRCVIEQAIEEAALPEEFFDVVTFRDSIEHAFDPRLALEKSWRALKPGGVVVVSGATSGDAPPAELRRIFFLQLSVVGSTMGTRDELERLIELCVSKDVRPVIDRTLALPDARQGFEALLAGEVTGKVVFKC